MKSVNVVFPVIKAVGAPDFSMFRKEAAPSMEASKLPYPALEVLSFPQEIFFSLVVGTMLYFALHLMIRSLKRAADVGKTRDVREMIKDNRVALAGSAILLILVFVLPAFSAKFCMVQFAAIIAVIAVLGFEYHKIRRTGKDRGTGTGRISGWSCSLFAFVVFLIQLAWYPFPGDYRIKARNAGALSDLRDARTCLDAYRQKQKRYPDSLEQGGCAGQSKYVKVTYVKTGPDKYKLTSSPVSLGNREYKTDSDDPAVYWRSMEGPDAKWQRM